jgi:uncharacterized protein YecE (DUF72 family)
MEISQIKEDGLTFSILLKIQKDSDITEFFNTVEMDSTFYEEFYSKMNKGLFFGMVKATPQNFEFQSRFRKE